MYCRKCGNMIQDGMKVCAYCGTPVEGETADAQNQNSQGNQNGVYKESAPSYSGQSQNQSDYNQYNQNGYYQNPNQGYGTPQNMDGGARGLGITSMVLGIIALLIACCAGTWWLTLILAAVSIVLGIISMQKNDSGKAMSIAGIVCSIVALLLGVIIVVVGAALVSWLISFFDAMA